MDGNSVRDMLEKEKEFRYRLLEEADEAEGDAGQVRRHLR